MSAIEDRIRDRVERLCDMAPLCDAGSEAWAKWKQRVVAGVERIVAEEIERERKMVESAERFERAIR